VLLGDDGIGPYVARVLEAGYEFAEGVHVEDLGTPGLDLIAHMVGCETLILIDSVKNGKPAGSVTLYTREDIMRYAPATVRVDPHSPALSESILIAEFAGEAPAEVVLIGITGEHYESDRPISEAARGAAREAIRVVLGELDRLDVAWRKRARAAQPDIWWERMVPAAVGAD
jgi:hydrogenase maturation protease